MNIPTMTALVYKGVRGPISEALLEALQKQKDNKTLINTSQIDCGDYKDAELIITGIEAVYADWSVEVTITINAKEGQYEKDNSSYIDDIINSIN